MSRHKQQSATTANTFITQGVLLPHSLFHFPLSPRRRTRSAARPSTLLFFVCFFFYDENMLHKKKKKKRKNGLTDHSLLHLHSDTSTLAAECRRNSRLSAWPPASKGWSSSVTPTRHPLVRRTQRTPFFSVYSIPLAYRTLAKGKILLKNHTFFLFVDVTFPPNPKRRRTPSPSLPSLRSVRTFLPLPPPPNLARSRSHPPALSARAIRKNRPHEPPH